MYECEEKKKQRMEHHNQQILSEEMCLPYNDKENTEGKIEQQKYCRFSQIFTK